MHLININFEYQLFNIYLFKKIFKLVIKHVYDIKIDNSIIYYKCTVKINI